MTVAFRELAQPKPESGCISIFLKKIFVKKWRRVRDQTGSPRRKNHATFGTVGALTHHPNCKSDASGVTRGEFNLLRSRAPKQSWGGSEAKGGIHHSRFAWLTMICTSLELHGQNFKIVLWNLNFWHPSELTLLIHDGQYSKVSAVFYFFSS